MKLTIRMRTGTANVSQEQLRLLRVALSTPHPGELAEALDRVAHDTDIISGKEDLHPKWTEIFASRSDEIQPYLPVAALDHFRVFFGASGIDAAIADLDPGALSLSFLLGAGASKPAPSGIPTC
jgi:hypothetical protein